MQRRPRNNFKKSGKQSIFRITRGIKIRYDYLLNKKEKITNFENSLEILHIRKILENNLNN